MKKCKENYIKILTAMRDDNYDFARMYESSGKLDIAQKKREIAIAYQTAIWLLTDYDGSFEGFGKIYFPEEFEE